MNWTKKDIATVAWRTALLVLAVLIVIEFGLDIFRPAPDQRDALLGWKLKENYHRVFAQTTLGGQKYLADFLTNGDGFRVFGTNARAPIKILVLGDSFTADPYGSNDRMWYGRMVERLAEHMHRPLRDFYVLAGGAGGWGTYQELLLSQRISRDVKPNLFVLQFCSNDFSNNLYEWESKSIVRGQWMRRPFFDARTGRPKYAPGFMAVLFRSFLGETHLFTRIDNLIAGLQFKMYGGYARPLPTGVTAKYERDAVLLTRMLLIRLRQEYRGAPAIMVNCDGDDTGPNKHWRDLARDAGFVPLGGPSDFLRAVRGNQRKNLFHSDGGHLSNYGNQQYGAIVGDEIASLRLAPLSRR